MPFRGVRAEIRFGEPKHILTAQAGDIEVTLSCIPYGATGVSGGPNFIVGGPDIASEGGIVVTSNEFPTGLSEGDELWVSAAEDLPFASGMIITGLVRSAKAAARSGKHAAA